MNPASGDASITKVAFIRIPASNKENIAGDAKPGEYMEKGHLYSPHPAYPSGPRTV